MLAWRERLRTRPRGVTALEGGLVTKGGEFREGAHAAHGNRRSKTIFRMNVGVCAFDPRGSVVSVRRVGPLSELPLRD